MVPDRKGRGGGKIKEEGKEMPKEKGLKPEAGFCR